MYSSVVTKAAGIFVLKPVDNNYTTAGQAQLIPACVVHSAKGPVGKVFQVSESDWQTILGRPLPAKLGEVAEGLRQLKSALSQCQYAQIVRAMPDDARFPFLAFHTTTSLVDREGLPEPEVTPDPDELPEPEVELPEPEGTLPLITAGNLPYGQEPVISAGHWMVIWPVDGDPSTSRNVMIDAIDPVKKRLSLVFHERVNGEQVVIEKYQVGLDVDDRDDLGLTAYAPAVLESKSSRFRCQVADGISFDEIWSGIANFIGGTNGTEITTENWQAAWDLLRSEDVEYTHGFAAGIYDQSVLAHAAKICGDRLAQFKLDVPPAMTKAQARAWLAELNIDDYQVQAIHYPYKATDEWYGGKAVWGASGDLIAAKALCFETPTGNSGVAGVHFAPAGEKRGRINRRGIEPLHSRDDLTPEQQVDARITPVARGIVINDELNLWSQENYLRFEHVVAIHNDLCREFVTGAGMAKFEPDGLTRELLDNLCRTLGDKRVSAGAFVKPRDEQDGDEPYIYELEQVEIDLWQVTFYFCAVGVGRRIALQPILIK